MSDAGNGEQSGCPNNSETGIREGPQAQHAKADNNSSPSVQIADEQSNRDYNGNNAPGSNIGGGAMNDGSSNET